jgi:ABC-type transport system substrate-binding protein
MRTRRTRPRAICFERGRRMIRRRTLLASAALAATMPRPCAAQDAAVLTIARLYPFDTLDPQRGFDQASQQILRQTYSTLLTYAYLERPYKLEPDLLDAMPVLAADRVTYTFRLRKGVRFADNPCFPGGKGRELTADDVIYTIRRFADANVNQRSYFAMQGAVVGLDEFRAATAKAGPQADTSTLDIAGLRRIDKYRFTIRLTHENPLFLHALTLTPTSIVAVEAVQHYGDQLSVTPVGSGPFVAKHALERKGTLRLVRNQVYYRRYPGVGAPGDAGKGLLKDAGKKLPLVDVLEMPLIEEAQPAALKFLRGELDRRELDRANFAKLVTRGADGAMRPAADVADRFDIAVAPGGNTMFIAINLRDPVLGKSKLLRQALAAAIDPVADIDVLYNGRGVALQSLVPVDIAGNEHDTDAPVRRRDLALAKRLLAEAGYPEGRGLPPLTMRFPEADAEIRNEFDLLRSQLAPIGVKLVGEFGDVPTYLKAMDAGNFQLAFVAWYADYPDAENFYQVLYGRNTAPGPNYGAFANAAYDRGYEASRTMTNGPQRYEIFKTLNAIVRDEVPVIVLRESLRVDSVQKWIVNYKRNLFTTELPFLSVDMAAKKKGP